MPLDLQQQSDAAPSARVIQGDCLQVMRDLAAQGVKVQAIVTDPPAGIAFMGKAWDGDKGGRTAWIAWMRERAEAALALVPPGGHALVWALPRTTHWTVTAWEDAGWEVRDRVAHLFGTGFPKSHDVSKGIDATLLHGGSHSRQMRAANEARPGAGRTGASLPNNGVMSTERHARIVRDEPATPEAARWTGWGTALKPAMEDWWLLRRPLSGTVAANVLAHGTGAINVDACRVEMRLGDRKGDGGPNAGMSGTQFFGSMQTSGDNRDGKGRWPAHLVHDGSDEVEAAFAAFGAKGASGPVRAQHTASAFVAQAAGARDFPFHADAGSASRFFTKCEPDADDLRFHYSAKAGASDRAGSKHPTVKPQSLLRWLARLITPPEVLSLECASCILPLATPGDGATANAVSSSGHSVQDVRDLLPPEGPDLGVLLGSMQSGQPEEAPEGVCRVRDTIPRSGAQIGQNPALLLEAVRGQCGSSQASAMPAMPYGISPVEERRPEILQPQMRECIRRRDATLAGRDTGSEGLYSDPRTRTPDGVTGGLCDATPSRHGGPSGQEPTFIRSGTPPERREGRQSHREPCTNAEGGARQDPKAGAGPDHLPPLQWQDQGFGSCPTCGGALKQVRRPGTILDPFAGSGSMATAALREGFSALLIEQDAEYCADIRRRIAAFHEAPRAAAPSQPRLAL